MSALSGEGYPANINQQANARRISDAGVGLEGMKLYNIIWDFDGTLFNTDTAIVSAFVEVLQSSFGVMESVSRIELLVKTDPKHCAQVLSDEYSLDYATLLSQAKSTYEEIGLELQRPFGNPPDKSGCS